MGDHSWGRGEAKQTDPKYIRYFISTILSIYNPTEFRHTHVRHGTGRLGPNPTSTLLANPNAANAHAAKSAASHLGGRGSDKHAATRSRCIGRYAWKPTFPLTSRPKPPYTHNDPPALAVYHASRRWISESMPMVHTWIDSACRSTISRGRPSQARFLLGPPRLIRVYRPPFGGTLLSSKDSKGDKTCGSAEASPGWLSSD